MFHFVVLSESMRVISTLCVTLSVHFFSLLSVSFTYTVRIGYRVTGYNDLPGVMIGLTKIKIKTSKRHSKYPYPVHIGCSDISDITMGIEKSNHQSLHKKYQF